MPGFPWDKNRIQDLPDPEGSKGGSDDQLGTASDAIADAEAEQTPYVPPLPVPLSRPITRPDGMRGITSPPWMVNPPAALPGIGALVGGGVADQASDVPVNTVRIDNLTSQWVYFPEVQVWIPPLWVGRVFRYNGSHNRRVRFETPAGMTAFALNTAEVAVVTFYEEVLEEVDGEQLASGVIPGVPGAVAIAGDAGQAQTQAYSADATSQALLGLIVNSRLEAWNQATSAVDRLETVQSGAAVQMPTAGILGVAAGIWGFGTGLWVPAAARVLGDATVGTQLPTAGMWGKVSGSVFDAARIPKVFKQMASVAIGAGSAVTVWTPAAGLKPRLMGWVVSGTSGLVDASVTFFETSTTGTFMGETGFLAGIQSPASANYGPGGPIVSTSSAVIVAFSSTGLTLRGMVYGTEE